MHRAGTRRERQDLPRRSGGIDQTAMLPPAGTLGRQTHVLPPQPLGQAAGQIDPDGERPPGLQHDLDDLRAGSQIRGVEDTLVRERVQGVAPLRIEAVDRAGALLDHLLVEPGAPGGIVPVGDHDCGVLGGHALG